MKFLPSQLMTLLEERELRRNMRALWSFIAVLAGSVIVFSMLFHVIMVYEGQQHSWVTGLYWTLTVMSTLGFGDITFQSDLGRMFSVVVLVYGIVMLLIVAPFTFIRFFYAPWLEAQVRLRAPRELAPGVIGHVVICQLDEIAADLIPRLDAAGLPYVVIEPEAAEAAAMHGDDIHVVLGSRDANATYEAVRVQDARLVLANLGDAANTNVTLTVRDVAPDVPVVALAESADSIDVLELSGASHVIPLKQRLGEQLANRVGTAEQTAHRIGRFADLEIAEFPIHGTALAGRTIRDTRLRELTGLNVVGVWERGRLMAAHPDTMLTDRSVPVVVGTPEQLTELDALFVIYQMSDAPVLVIGGGKVGQSVCAALRRRGATVTILDADAGLRAELEQVADRVVIGDASNLQTVQEAGIEDAGSIVLTTNDDATNIFLAVYCAKLATTAHIISRITHDWNLEAIHRAGADFALSHGSLAVQTLFSLIRGRELVVVGEGAELFIEQVPEALAGKSLASSGIGARTGLNVIAVRENGNFVTNLTGDSELPSDAELLLLGSSEQRERFLQLDGSD